MKARKLMAVALCAAACVTTTMFAEDDFGIESASPVKIAEPVNPQPGMVLLGYSKRHNSRSGGSWLRDSIPTLQKAPALKTVVDKSEVFSLKALGNTEANVGMWSGFLKCKRASVYTFTLAYASGTNIRYSNNYSMRVNGKPVIPSGGGQSSVDVVLNVGWNKIDLVCQFSGNGKGTLSIVYKPKESLSDARPLTPAMVYHDQKPEEDW